MMKFAVWLALVVALLATQYVVRTRGDRDDKGDDKGPPGDKKPPHGKGYGYGYGHDGGTIPPWLYPYLRGREGRTGRDGEKGAKGDKGERGPRGAVGEPGTTRGDVGERGMMGNQGAQGPDGEKGDKGMKGQMGESGRNGTTLSGGASTYVNWGVNNCPNGNEVYTGRAVSPKFNNAGGGAQYLCLPDSPMNDDVTVSDAAATSTLVGVHFETYANPSPDFPNSDPTDMDLEPLSDHDGEPVLCAVCQSMDSAVVMIPNNLECPDTGIWSMEYTGYLMAARDFIFIGDLDLRHNPVFGNPDAHFRTEYICVNNNPSGGGSNAVPADPTTEAKLAHTRIYCTSVTGFDEAACLPYTMDPTDQIELCTDINGVVHCSFGPLGCVVCTASQAPIATP